MITVRDKAALAPVGIDPAAYGQLGYSWRAEEYTVTQKIGEAAHFLGCDGLLVPNARWTCLNAVLFMGRVSPDQISVQRDHGPVDWAVWKKSGS